MLLVKNSLALSVHENLQKSLFFREGRRRNTRDETE